MMILMTMMMMMMMMMMMIMIMIMMIMIMMIMIMIVVMTIMMVVMMIDDGIYDSGLVMIRKIKMIIEQLIMMQEADLLDLEGSTVKCH